MRLKFANSSILVLLVIQIDAIYDKKGVKRCVKKSIFFINFNNRNFQTPKKINHTIFTGTFPVFSDFYLFMRYTFGLFLFYGCLCVSTVRAQKDSANAFHATLLNASYGFKLPAADLAQRFGFSMSVGGGLENVSLKTGWIYGVEGFYFFGTDVKEDVLSAYRTTDGNILSDIGNYAGVELRERGYYAGIHAGKIFKLTDNGNKFGGLRCTFGIGFMQHKIRLQDDNNSFAQVHVPYDAGYDRLTNGMAFNQFIGYQLLSRDKKVNFFLGAEITEGITKNRRVYNFDTRQTDTRTRLEMLAGIRVGWSFVLSTHKRAEDIEY